MTNLSKEAKAMKNVYMKEWRKKNPDKVKEYGVNYWEKKAAVIALDIDQSVKGLSAAGYTQREISNELNISLGMVNKYLHKQ